MTEVDAGKGGKGGDAADGPAVFTAEPSVWEIPPHESRFISVYFNPKELKTYHANFLATVDTGGSAATDKDGNPRKGTSLDFKLIGSGTMPCIAVEKPTERGEDGALKSDFGRVHIGRTRNQSLVLRNDGVLRTTCLIECEGDKDFVCNAAGGSLVLEPNESKEIGISFKPIVVGENADRTATVKVTVLNNPFDIYTLNLSGNTYSCDAVVNTASDDMDTPETTGEEDGLSEDVNFDPINLVSGTKTSSKTITLTN